MTTCLIVLAALCHAVVAAGAQPHWWHDDIECSGTNYDLRLDDDSVTISIAGYIGSGKSSLIETLLKLPNKISNSGFETGTMVAASYTVTPDTAPNHCLHVIDTPGFGDPDEAMVTSEATNANLLAQDLGHFKRLYYVVDPSTRTALGMVAYLRTLASVYGSEVARSVRIIVNKCENVSSAMLPAISKKIGEEYQRVFGEELPQGRVLYVSAHQCIRQLVHDIRQASRESDLDLSASRQIYVRPRVTFNRYRTSTSGLLCAGVGHEFPAVGVNFGVTASFHGAYGAGKSRLIEQVVNLAQGTISNANPLGVFTRQSQVYPHPHIPNLTLVDCPGFGDRNELLNVLQQTSAAMENCKRNPSFCKRIYYVIDGSRASVSEGNLRLLKLLYGENAARAIRFVVNKCDLIGADENPEDICNRLTSTLATPYSNVFDQELSPGHILYTSAELCIVQLVGDLCQAENDAPLDFKDEFGDETLDIDTYLGNIDQANELHRQTIAHCFNVISEKLKAQKDAVITEWVFISLGAVTGAAKFASKGYSAVKLLKHGSTAFSLMKNFYKASSKIKHLGKASCLFNVAAGCAKTCELSFANSIEENYHTIKAHEGYQRQGEEYKREIYDRAG